MDAKNVCKKGSRNNTVRNSQESNFSISSVYTIFKLFLLHLVLKIHKVSYGKKLRGNSCLIKNRGRIKLGNHIFLHSYPDGTLRKTALLTHCNSSLIQIGDNCVLNGTTIHSRKAVIIGNNCMFGPGVVIIDNDSHNTSIDPATRRFGKIAAKEVIIGDNVWIGMNSIILKGVHIGNNSIIAAGAVVSNNVPSNQIFGGNPALLIKKLEID